MCILKRSLWLWPGEQIGGEPEGRWGAEGGERLGGSGCSMQPVHLQVGVWAPLPLLGGSWVGTFFIPLVLLSDFADTECCGFGQGKISKDSAEEYSSPARRPVSFTVRACVFIFWRPGRKGI